MKWDKMRNKNVLTDLQHRVAVGVWNVRLEAGEVSLVVMTEVKVLNAKFRVLDLHLPVAFRHLHKRILS